MDVVIGEMTSTVRVTDSQALLSPQVLREIARLVSEQVREMQAHAARVDDERRVRPGASAKETPNWG
jgi:cell division protein ZapA (FtsZ GTPase activity inhibitor)